MKHLHNIIAIYLYITLFKTELKCLTEHERNMKYSTLLYYAVMLIEIKMYAM